MFLLFTNTFTAAWHCNRPRFKSRTFPTTAFRKLRLQLFGYIPFVLPCFGQHFRALPTRSSALTPSLLTPSLTPSLAHSLPHFLTHSLAPSLPPPSLPPSLTYSPPPRICGASSSFKINNCKDLSASRCISKRLPGLERISVACVCSPGRQGIIDLLLQETSSR